MLFTYDSAFNVKSAIFITKILNLMVNSFWNGNVYPCFIYQSWKIDVNLYPNVFTSFNNKFVFKTYLLCFAIIVIWLFAFVIWWDDAPGKFNNITVSFFIKHLHAPLPLTLAVLSVKINVFDGSFPHKIFATILQNWVK